MKILITGANGTVGTALCSVLDQSEHQIVRTVRKSSNPREISIGELNQDTHWGDVLGKDTDVVVHLAGQVPTTNGWGGYNANRYSRVNTLATKNLAMQCARLGVKRFIFISTVKVLGEGKPDPYRETDLAMPSDTYAVSKWEAEKALRCIAIKTGMEVVMLRPPLVYGPNVKGNFFRLVHAIDKRWPLPLGSINNRRSSIFLGNLVDAICLCLTHPKAEGRTFLVSDGYDVSTPELVRRIAAALGRQHFLLPIPVECMRRVGHVLGKQTAVDRLLGSLYVDITCIQKELGWRPSYTMQAGLEAMARWYHDYKAGI